MSHLDPIVIDGLKFDKGMTLFEFDAFREPEKTRFQKIGEYVKARCQMNEIPAPQMYWQGKYWPDLYIANQLDAVRPLHLPRFDLRPQKHLWADDYSLRSASLENHGVWFHDNFIEPMCHKITGRNAHEIAAKFHRSIWLPLYWPETLREGKSLRTPFWYPRSGYAGAVRFDQGSNTSDADERSTIAGEFDTSQITITFLLAKPRHEFSVLFVVDPSPIYRITDMDVCAGIDAEWHRWVVEHRGPLFLHSCEGFTPMMPDLAEQISYLDCRTINLPLPTIANVKRGWKPAKNINEKIWEDMQCW